MLSIIIPSYQQAEHLDNALQSIEKQVFENYEILVIDACSTDNTAFIVAKFKHLPINFIQSPDEGVYDAMNKGVKLSKGDWIYFLGCDDVLYDSNVLSNLNKYFINDRIDIIYGNVLLKSNMQYYDGEFSLSKLLFEKNICHQSIFYKRSIFEKLGPYNLSYKIWADWDFNIRCFKNTNLNIAYVDVVVALYNDVTGISSTSDELFRKELPVFYMSETQCLQRQHENLINSRSYRLSMFISKLFKLIR